MLRIEAENMTLDNYLLESGKFASNEKFIKLKDGVASETGTASFNFSEPSGLYDLVVGYFDENDGISHLEVRKQNTLIDDWDFDQNLGSNRADAQTQTRRTIATQLEVNQGEKIQIKGKENNGEPARIDYIEFIPVTPVTINGTNATDVLVGNAKNNTLNGLAGNDVLRGGAGDDTLNGGSGIDTANYSKFTEAIIANLDTGIVLKPMFGTLLHPKIMPLGDSITAGHASVDPHPGAYRIQLWANLLADDFSVDLVGSQSEGPASLGDQDHEGHGGWSIQRITNLVKSGIINTYKPNLVLLMIGTNNTGNGSLSELRASLSNLIDQITEQSSNAQVLVSSIAPIDPSTVGPTKAIGEERAKRTEEFNALIPGLVTEKAAQGKKVAFVNAGGSLTTDDLVSDGKHPNAEGYDKMGNAWYTKLVGHDTLTGIENVIGTAFDDKLQGNDNDNMIKGGVGRDTLTGGAGNDTFVYEKPTEGRDLITDFGIDDGFRISASHFGGGLIKGVGLSMSASSTGVLVSEQNPTSIGTSANFLYSTITGILSFDVDGIGSNAALALAKLAYTPSLSINQFSIIS